MMPVCLSLVCADVPEPPRHKKKDTSTGDLGACAGCSRRCAGDSAARGWQGATCWLSAERKSLVGGDWASPLRSCCETTGWEHATRKRRRRACSWEQRPCATCPATNRRGPCPLAAVAVAVGGGRALPRLRCHPRGNTGFGLDEKKKKCTWY